MKIHDFHFRKAGGLDTAFLFGLAGGRVDYMPEAKHLYSLRLFFAFWRVEILWTTGDMN